MNTRAITKALELTDDDWELATKLRGLSETERELLKVALGPPAKVVKKAGKKARTKSPHAASLTAAIKRAVADDRPAPTTCTFPVNGAETCGATEDDTIHDTTYTSSHPFTRGEQAVGASGN